VLLGGAGNDILIGGLGNDVLSGSTGANTFQVPGNVRHLRNFGKDIIVDFHLGQDTNSRSITRLFANFAALQAAISEDCHGNAVITADANTLDHAGRRFDGGDCRPSRRLSISCKAAFRRRGHQEARRFAGGLFRSAAASDKYYKDR